MNMDDDGRGSLAKRKWTVLQLVSYWVTITDIPSTTLAAWINEHYINGKVVTTNED